MKIQINGEQREFPEPSLRLNDLIEKLSLAPQRIAVEVNKQIIARGDWASTTIEDGCRIEIVHFVGGGMGFERPNASTILSRVNPTRMFHNHSAFPRVK